MKMVEIKVAIYVERQYIILENVIPNHWSYTLHVTADLFQSDNT